MGDETQSIRVRVGLTNRGASVDLTVHIPHGPSGPVDSRGDCKPFAAALAQYRIEMLRHPACDVYVVTDEHFGAREAYFFSAHDFLRNAKRHRTRAGKHLAELQGIKAHEDDGRKVIKFDPALLGKEAVTFVVYGGDGRLYDFDSRSAEAAFQALFEYLVDARSGEDLLRFLKEGSDEPPRVGEFAFGRAPTKTWVVHPFPDGLPAERITCRVCDGAYTVPPDVQALVDLAGSLLQSDAPGLWAMPDQPMLAPRQVGIFTPDPDAEADWLQVSLCHSSYRHYIAFAVAEHLAARDARFRPLLDFVRQVPDPRQPAPASCSIGVRVLVETTDAKLVVAHRSKDAVKMNPDVWSVSANEGVRTSLLQPGADPSALLRLAVDKALRTELRVDPGERQPPLLLSVYRNAFNQWGAGFYVKVDLDLAELVRRHPVARHRYEHSGFHGLPLDVDACGRAMRDLGTRWYGGALETICAGLAWRHTGGRTVLTPADVGYRLSKAAGDSITPIDEVNPALLPRQ